MQKTIKKFKRMVEKFNGKLPKVLKVSELINKMEWNSHLLQPLQAGENVIVIHDDNSIDGQRKYNRAQYVKIKYRGTIAIFNLKYFTTLNGNTPKLIIS